MLRRISDVAVVLTSGLWVVMGGWLFGDVQPNASAAWYCFAHCTPPILTCPRSVGTCTGCTGRPFGLCTGNTNWWIPTLCWDGPHCFGTTVPPAPAGTCACTPAACF